MAEVSVGRALRDGYQEGEHAAALSIRDSLACPLGPQIFNHFLGGLASNILSSRSSSRGLVLVALDQSPSFYLHLLKAGGSSVCWIRVLDCYSDPLGWKSRLHSSVDEATSGDELRRNFSDLKNMDKLASRVLDLGKEMVGEGKNRFAVALDSISTLLRQAPLASVAGLISNLRSHGQVSSMMWMVRSDLHEHRICAAFDYLSTMTAILEPEIEYRGSDSSLRGGRFHLRMKRRNGRLKIINEEFIVDTAGVKFSDPLTEIKTSKQTLIPKLQFNLQLSEKEQMDKERVILPFEHQGNRKKVEIYDGRRSIRVSRKDENEGDNYDDDMTIKSTGSEPPESTRNGKIHYIRDSDDEHPDSDEDPDDDLDI